MPFLLYAATAVVLLWIVHRWIRPISLASALVLAVVPLGIVGPALVTGGVYGPIDHLYQYEPHAALAAQHGIGLALNASAVDVISEFFPWRLAVRESLRRGEWPLWNPYNLAGHPLAAEAQSAPYSPFTLIACLLPAAVSMSYTAAIALFVAALAAFLLARELGCSEPAAVLAGIGWSLSSSVVIYSQTAMGFATAYLPLLLAATRRVVWQPGVAAAALLAATLALTALAGHPESLFLNVLAGCAYGLFELVRRRSGALRVIATAAGAGVVAFAVCAIFLLPLLEAIPQSFEYVHISATQHAEPISMAKVLATLATNVFPHLHVRTWESPRLGLIAVETAAVGSILLALALCGVGLRRPETWFFAATALVGIVVGARWPPLTNALRAVPLMDITRLERLAFVAAACLCVLAAFGFDALLRAANVRRAVMTLALVLVMLAAGTWWLSRNVDLEPASYGQWRIPAELLFLAAAAIVLALRPRTRVLVPALLGLVLGQRLLSEYDTFRTYPAAAAYPPLAIVEPLKQVKEPFRVAGRGTVLPPAANTFYGVEDPRGYEALTFAPFMYTEPLWCRRETVWFNRIDDLSRPFLSFLNVRFIIQDAASDVPTGWRALRVEGGMSLLENERVIERAFVPRQVALTQMTAEEAVQRMESVTDFRDIAWINTEDTNGVRDNGPGRVTLTSRRLGGEYELVADMQRAGWLVVSDIAWKGWQATIDGRATPVHRANTAFVSVFVPEGRHAVRLLYRPWSFVIGAWISFVALVGIAFVMVKRRMRRRPAHPARGAG
ncbi:MAG TPA: YfhO family protein [Thermoanaerobaculia bacterium]